MQIHYVAKRGDIQAVARQQMRGQSIDTSVLMMAARSHHAGIDMLKFLVKGGAEVNWGTSEADISPLGEAAKSGSYEKTKFLLEMGADPKFSNRGRYTPLINAVYGSFARPEVEQAKVIRLLLEAGANPKSVSAYGESAVGVASHFGRFDIVKMLVEAGANTDVVKWNSLMDAIALGTLQDLKTELAKRPDLSTER